MTNQRAETLEQLAATCTRMRIHAPLALVLDILSPIDVVSCQCAQFVRPFVAGQHWERYAVVLTDEASWQELRRLLAR